MAHSQAPCIGLHLPLRFGRAARLCRAANAVLTPPLLAGLAPSVVHRTYYAAHPGYARAPLVITVFDMIHELYPKLFPPGDPMFERKRLSVEAADHVICISQSTANDLMRLFNVPERKISVTYLGYSDVFRQWRETDSASTGGRRAVLYVGHRGGYKNFQNALKAYAGSSALRSNFDFLAFGGPPFDATERAFIDSLRVRPGSVTWRTGSDEDLARAYREAQALIYPSLYEGFGIPPLEAMASGCPVACSNTSSLPEVVGSAALLFDPSDADAVQDAMERVCTSDQTRRRLVVGGTERAQQFSWTRCAADTVRAYANVLGGA